MAKDYYASLGVSRSASQADVKAAYKKLAKEHHPDLNKDNPASEAKFKEINEAYRVLGDEKKRASYDRHGADEQAQSQGNPYEGYQGGGFDGFDINLGDIFGDFFGGGTRRGARRGADIEVIVRITLEEASTGAKVPVRVDRDVPCKSCDGTGAKGGKRTTCSTCKGAGQVRRTQRTPFGVVQVVGACETCHGQGSIAEENCAKCKGTGKEEREETLSIEIPAGIMDRMQLRVPGKGNAGSPGQPPGDLLVGVLVEEHELFTRDGDDLLVQSTITYPQAVLGTKLEVPTLHGSVTLQVPPGTQSHTTLRVRGKGTASLRGGSGDLLVTVKVDVPSKLSKKERELIEELGGVEKPKSFFERLGL
jgi:molecular chaperone DnaJ